MSEPDQTALAPAADDRSADDASDGLATRVSAWWAGAGAGQRVLVGAIGLIVVVNVALAGLRTVVGGSPGGPVSSSFGTGGAGLEAYADLLRADGRSVVRLRRSPTAEDLPAGATAVVADPERLTEDEALLLRSFVHGGGRLVATGATSEALVQLLTGTAPAWSDGRRGTDIAVWVAGDDTGSAQSLRGRAEGGWWSEPGPLLPVAGARDRAVVLTADVGDGRLVAVADTAVLQNDHLAAQDNAAFALAAAGSRDRPVVFLESVHGLGGEGLDAVPSRWKWVAAGTGVALLASLWWAGSRFGPPEPDRRRLRPPRRDHVDAVAAGIDRVASDAEVAAPLADRLRASLAERLGEPPDCPPEVLRAAARRAGLDPAEVDLALDPPGRPDDLVALGALAARHHALTLGPGALDADAPGTVTSPPVAAGTVPSDPPSQGAHP